jgi:glutamyl-tRNA reductase
MGVNQIAAASFAYPRHDSAVRARLARRLLTAPYLDDGFVLSTCLRVEVVVPGDESRLHDALVGLFGELADAAHPEIRVGERAVTHLYRIAAGLESPILGEREILTQVRHGLLEAEEAGRINGVFARILERAVAVGRQARELIPGTAHNSMAAVAAQAVGTAPSVGVIGSGVMATATVEALLMLPSPPLVTVVARQPEKVPAQAGVEVCPFSAAPEVIASHPVVISATSARQRIIDDTAVAGSLSRRDQPLLLVDLAMPPDFAPLPSGNVSYLGIDDLARLADRRGRSEQADAMVESAAEEAHRQYRDHHQVGPLIGGLMAGADEVVDRAVRRFSGRLADQGDEAILRQTAHTVARTLLAGPVEYLKRSRGASEAVEMIADAFGVDDG